MAQQPVNVQPPGGQQVNIQPPGPPGPAPLPVPGQPQPVQPQVPLTQRVAQLWANHKGKIGLGAGAIVLTGASIIGTSRAIDGAQEQYDAGLAKGKEDEATRHKALDAKYQAGLTKGMADGIAEGKMLAKANRITATLIRGENDEATVMIESNTANIVPAIMASASGVNTSNAKGPYDFGAANMPRTSGTPRVIFNGQPRPAPEAGTVALAAEPTTSVPTGATLPAVPRANINPYRNTTQFVVSWDHTKGSVPERGPGIYHLKPGVDSFLAEEMPWLVKSGLGDNVKQALQMRTLSALRDASGFGRGTNVITVEGCNKYGSRAQDELSQVQDNYGKALENSVWFQEELREHGLD